MAETYLGNPQLSKAGLKREWTEEQVREWVKCKEDPIYFIETYMTIVNLDEGEIKFKLRDYQKEMVHTMVGNRMTYLLTARQVGKSVTTCGFLLHYAIFNSFKSIAILANKGETAREILSRVQFAYERLPHWLKHGVTTYNKGKFELENGSKFLAAASSASAVRGYSISCLFVDELAFVENWPEFSASVLPTVTSSKETKIIFCTTPNGMNHAYRYYVEVKEGRSDFKLIEVNWRQVPGRDEEWRRQTLSALGNDFEKFAAEYETEFLGSSGTLIAGWKLKELVHQTPTHDHQGLKVYKEPVPGHNYALCADVSEGKGFDYSTFSVVDVTQMPYEQVCTYRNNMVTSSDFAMTIYQVGKKYHDAAVLVEVNIALGPAVVEMLHQDLGYEHVLFTASAGAKGKKVTNGFGTNVDMGLRTSRTTKATGCAILKMLIEGNQLIINDHDTISELSTFSRDARQSFSAEAGCHDDAVMALVLFAWLSSQNYFAALTDIHTLSKLREKTDEDLMEEVMPFGIIDDGLPPEPEGITIPNFY